MYRIRSALQMKPGFSLLKIPFHHLCMWSRFTLPEISPHDSPAGSSLWLSQGPNCLSRLGHACRRGEPGGWRAPPGQFSSAAGSQEPPAQKVQPHPPLRANDQAWASSRSSLTKAVSTSSGTPGSPLAPAG